MKISAVKNYSISYNGASKAKKTNLSQTSVSKPIYQSAIAKQDIELQLVRQQSEFEDFLNKTHRVSKEEYEDIKKNHPHILLKAQNYIEKYEGATTPLQLAKMTLLIYKYLKENYGDYRIISIGTSPSAISEQLEKLGCDVIYVPISGLGRFDIEKDNIEDTPELIAILNYIHSKNLNDEKLNLVLDFSVTGATLKNITELIKEYCSLENTISVSLEPLMVKAICDMYSKVFHARQNLLDDIWECKIEEISSTPHFPISGPLKFYYQNNDKENTIFLDNEDNEKLFKKFENSATPLSRAFSLCTMAEIDNLKRNGEYDS